LTLLLLVGIQARPGSSWRPLSARQASTADSEDTGLADAVSHRWAAARLALRHDLEAVADAPSPRDGLEQFLKASTARASSFTEVETLAGLTLEKLEAKQQEFADPHLQSLLPAEVLPELAQALRDHQRGVQRIQRAAHTLNTLTLPDIEVRLTKLAEACRLKSQLSGKDSAQQMWRTGVLALAADLRGE
jgi:hypothetical protein